MEHLKFRPVRKADDGCCAELLGQEFHHLVLADGIERRCRLIEHNDVRPMKRDVRVSSSDPIALTSIIAPGGRRPPDAPEGSVASGKAFVKLLASLARRGITTAFQHRGGLTPDQIEERLRSVGRNQITHQARHTIVGELVGRSINPLNLLLLSLSTASYFLGDQRAAIAEVPTGRRTVAFIDTIRRSLSTALLDRCS
jgi:hypothetical protein